MKKLTLIVGIVALSACNEAKAPEAPATDEAVLAAPTPGPGKYDVFMADGSPGGSTVLNADGTYTDSDADGSLVAEGSWAMVDGKTCFTPTTEGQEAMCFTESARAADGSFTATPDKGEPVTVKPAAAEAAQ